MSLHDALEIARAALVRIGSGTEMAGLGPTEEMTGPGAVEMRCRMKHAELALEEMDAALSVRLVDAEQENA